MNVHRPIEPRAHVGKGVAHDSGLKHVTGAAVYIDDLPELPGTLHAALVLSPVAKGRLASVDVSAARAMEGVVDVVLAADVTGHNDVGPILRGEPIFADGEVLHIGQVVAAVAADTIERAHAAARLVAMDIEPVEPVLDVDTAHARRDYVSDPQVLEQGDGAAALDGAPHRLKGRLNIGGQDHFYLETQIAYAVPGEDGELLVHSSTQHPSEVQHHVALALGLPASAVEVRVRRMGGAFGGKESQATGIACIAALLAERNGRPVKLRLRRAEDMAATGKRHDMGIAWEAGFDGRGRLAGVAMEFLARAGHVADLSPPVITRAISHADNCYHLPSAILRGYTCRTNTVSNTAFRGFGGPQGMIAIENLIDAVARHLRRDPNEVRAVNFYAAATGEETPYGQRVEDNRIDEVVERVMQAAGWIERRRAIDAHNAADPVIRRGLALMPAKFGISFNLPSLNQAGALVHVYLDGSVHLNHGGTEMGQGLFIKVAQVVAEAFQIPLEWVRITPTSTAKVPNTSATAASTGSDLNGMAALIAAGEIRDRMTDVAARHLDAEREAIAFRDGHVYAGNASLSFPELARLCWAERVSLSAAGHYKTPKIHWDPKRMKGRPFFYFTYGAAVAEVAIDTLTGETRCLRADIVQDLGFPLNPAVDLGQIEGGFVQGMGWLTSEELWWDSEGRLRTVGPSTYKIPGSRDAPREFNVTILDDVPNREETVYRSKAVGEPPLMLAISVWLAIKDAIGSIAPGRPVPLDAPATPERVLFAVDAVRGVAD